jgi:hypothetical protein
MRSKWLLLPSVAVLLLLLAGSGPIGAGAATAPIAAPSAAAPAAPTPPAAMPLAGLCQCGASSCLGRSPGAACSGVPNGRCLAQPNFCTSGTDTCTCRAL